MNRTILLVDDDALARVGIKSIANLNDHGYEIIAEAENGSKAFELAKELHPDIILSDVKMPGLNGVELLKKCRQSGIASIFIMLSSHDDFDYVKEALTNGAIDYILKYKLNEKSLISVLNKAEVKKDMATADTICPGKSSDDMMREILYKKGPLDDEERENLKRLTAINGDLFCVVIVKMLSRGNELLSDADLHRLKTPSSNLCIEIAAGYEGCTTFFLGGRTHIFYLPINYADSSKKSTEKLLDTFVVNIREMFKFVLNVSAIVGISNITSNQQAMKNSFLDAEKAVRHALVSNTPVCHISEVSANHGDTSEMNDCIGMISKCIMTLDSKKIDDVFMNMKSIIFKNSPALPQQIAYGYTLLFTLNKHLVLTSSEKPLDDYETMLNSVSSKEDFIVWLDKIRLYIDDNLCTNNEQINQILKAKTYIDNNYGKSINLESVAQEINLSPTYLSKRFQQLIGVKFIDYITSVRLEKAQYLLRTTNYKVFAIANMVGYDNNTYFCYLFKKKTGMSPQEYRLKK